MPDKILIVDDDVKFVKMLGMCLKADGCQVLVAYDKVQAIKQIHEGQPDLIILDIKLPGGSGFDVYEHVRDSIDTAMIPIIFISGLGKESVLREERVKKRAMELGNSFLAKPFTAAEILAEVRNLLQGPKKAALGENVLAEEKEMLKWIAENK